MRTLVHISDLHFGRTDDQVVATLLETIKDIKPDLLVVSGDLTQRAKEEQFVAAREFLDSLPYERIVVPGNHDVPLYNIFSRFFRPLTKYRRLISENLEPTYIDSEIAVIGLSTARSLVVKNGRINEKQIARVREKLKDVSPDVVRVIVTHHPFDLDMEASEGELVGRAACAMQAFAAMKVDLLLAGHVHTSGSSTTASRYQLGDYSAVFVQAGTATSTRLRHEANTFNVIQISSAQITVQKMEWRADQRSFQRSEATGFVRTEDRWIAG